MKFTLAIPVIALLPYTIGHVVSHRQRANQIAGAAYFMTNEPTGNFIISSAIGNDGKVSIKSATFAGGVGSKILQTPAPNDPFFSAGSVTVSGNYLYAVNAGSNTIATFEIDPMDPTKLQAVGKPVNSGGEFPISLAVAKKRGLICVLNAGRLNGVNCYKPNASRGLIAVPNTQRLLNLNQTTPPQPQPGPNGFSDIIFNEEETTVLISVRNINGESRGVLAAWDINTVTGALSAKPRELNAPGAQLPFSLVVLPGKNAILATDPLFGYDIFDLTVGPHDRSANFSIPGELALCWSIYNPKTGNLYLVDSPTGIISEITVNNQLQSSTLKQYHLPGDGDALDTSLATVNGKQFLYVLVAGTQAINVLSVQGPGNVTVIQQLGFAVPLTKLGVTQDQNYIAGMAIYLTSLY
ncbi:hypothetical protein M422DRAFT_250238 [Sphaerobolus stellatus SS14]|uniref:Unplaced genomic scaffold SPHSTscaffold_33, whole genome shotgun sequence n=1 Tax=Sphaerobolus stellatus (strain SS14) TaxID=990650 RepID=A0A0C9W377_SPHS4|nr:hypothetical protein M422DRAFT_250238 [Sphaerobolus stellatus SS14]